MMRVLPGFRSSLTLALMYLTAMVVVPLVACVATVSSLTFQEFWAAVWTPRARSAYALTFGASFASAAITSGLGILLAWVLVRYEFPFKRVLDALVDLPFALPTAVAGLVYSSLYVENGWLGRFLVPLDIHLAYSRSAIVLVLVFIGLPFSVRTVQPVLESFDVETEEAAHSLGATRWQTFWRVILPALIPATITGFALSLARGLGEYGSVVFVSNNRPFETEIAPQLIVQRLQEFHYREAASIAVVLLAASFTLLLVINLLERWSKRYEA
ncbi:MAG: sulfate ABC transporter permease subunit CysT [Planctomycetaceae bacterium]|nr:sulfate ABC transporter permease subunit CysT [Planctomycetaceae bacterium]